MKDSNRKILFLSMLALSFCNYLAGSREKTANNTSGICTLKVSGSATEYEQVNSDCVRGVAAPIIVKAVFPKTTFQLQPDKVTAVETVEFDNGDKLTIRNWGCESYVLTFRFETSRFQNDTTNIPFWFKKTVLLLIEIYKGLDAPIDIKKGTDKLINHIDINQQNSYQKLKLGDEIDFGGSDIRNYVKVDRIEKLTKKKFAIEVSFVKGPL